MAQKKSYRKKTSRKAKKPKVYIPAYKIIILCALIITVCMSLLLVTAIKSPDKPVLTERFEEEKPAAEETKQNTSPAPKKSEQKKSAEKNTVQKQAETKKESVKTPVQNQSVKIDDKQNVDKSDKKPADKSAQKSVTPKQKTPEPEPAQEKKETVQTDKYNFPQAKNNAQLVFLLDDGGQNLSHLKPFLNLPFPVTIAVLPRLPNSQESARLIRDSKKHELMLHQPMQAINNKVNPGPGAITPEMTESQIRTTLFNNINEVGPVAGINNHEGSAITADAEKMAVILNITTENGIFFLDSRTNKDTAVPYVAGEMGYSYYERNGYFLDNEKSKGNALKELRRNLDIANKNGSVIMIGHIWSADFLPEFLTEVYPELKEKGYTFTTVSKSKGIKNSH